MNCWIANRFQGSPLEGPEELSHPLEGTLGDLWAAAVYPPVHIDPDVWSSREQGLPFRGTPALATLLPQGSPPRPPTGRALLARYPPSTTERFSPWCALGVPSDTRLPGSGTSDTSLLPPVQASRKGPLLHPQLLSCRACLKSAPSLTFYLQVPALSARVARGLSAACPGHAWPGCP